MNAAQAGGAAATADVRTLHVHFVGQLNNASLAFAPGEFVRTFAALGLNGLSQHNGFSMMENAQLALSQDVHEILGLIVKWLVSRISSAERG